MPLPLLSRECVFNSESAQRLIEVICTARSVEVETRNAELNGNRNPEWWGDFSELVKIEKIRFLGISRYKVKVKF